MTDNDRYEDMLDSAAHAALDAWERSGGAKPSEETFGELFDALDDFFVKLWEPGQGLQGLHYEVTTADGAVHRLPATVWWDDCLAAGDTYDPDNCEWWDDVVDGLRAHVPGTAELASVRVVAG